MWGDTFENIFLVVVTAAAAGLFNAVVVRVNERRRKRVVFRESLFRQGQKRENTSPTYY